MKKIIAISALLLTSQALAGFSSQKVVSAVKVNRIFDGSGGPTYVTFKDGALPECANADGGYLRTSWADANNGVVDDAGTSRVLSILLAAKAMNTKVEVRYIVNDAGTGWNKCAITGIYMH